MFSSLAGRKKVRRSSFIRSMTCTGRTKAKDKKPQEADFQNLNIKFENKLQIKLTKYQINDIMRTRQKSDGGGEMLLEFSCSNHKSIKEKITFSMLAGKDTMFEDELKNISNFRVSRMAVIYGANGSGKSNFIHAMEFCKALVENSINHQPGQGVFQAPHKLSAKEMPSTYDLQFITKGVRYAYGFSVKQNLIDEEYLYYFPNGRQTKIFERQGLEIQPGSRYKKAFELSLNVLKDNRLFLSCAANYTNLKEIEEAFVFFRDDVVVYNHSLNNWKEYSVENMLKDEDLKKTFLRILNYLGSDVKDLKMIAEKKKFDISELPAEMPDFIKSMMTSQESSIYSVNMVYDGFQTDLVTEESDGIQKLFEIICPLLDILHKGKVLLWDEIETGLHEAIVYEILKIFKSTMPEKFAQMIFTTHDTGILDADIFRRDQIWFTQLNSQRATDLYSLTEIRNVRKGENLAKGYISGKYGAIPMLNRDFKDEFGNVKVEE